jgi:hypothetical protein
MAAKLRQRGYEALLALALARGRSVREAAREAGISERTAHRRLGSADFRRQIYEARSALLDATAGALADAAGRAAATLIKLLAAEHETVRLAAAKSILEHALNMRSAIELADRLTALEQRLGDACQ